jgi:hypothetical protein
VSAARNIRDGIIERIPVLPFFRKFKIGRSQDIQIMPTDLPYVAVYLLSESGSPDGDYNAGEPKLKLESRIGISVMLKNIESNELEDALDTAHDVLMAGLLTDATFWGFQTAYQIEGLVRMSRQLNYGQLGATNETPIGELRLELTFATRFDYPPNIVDDLKLIHLETAYPSIEERESVQQVIAPFDLTVEDSPA